MTSLQVYLSSEKTRKVLNRRPGDEGFSLIELVVVVAVLAILAAIAIPSFTSINDKAKASAAMNTLAQIAKECAVKDANNETLTFNLPALQNYGFYPNSGTNCNGDDDGDIEARSDDTAKYPTYKYNVNTGAKSCTHAKGNATDPLHGCSKQSAGVW